MVNASPREFGIEFELGVFTDGKAGDRRIPDAAFEVRVVCYEGRASEASP